MKKALYILGQLSDKDVAWLADKGSKQEIGAGTTLIKEGENTPYLYIVLSGMLSVSIGHPPSREVAQSGIGEILGEMSFVDTRPPSATVTAHEDSVVLAIPQAQLAAKLQADTGFAARFYRAVAIFLSYRLRDRDHRASGRDGMHDPDELDDNVLDQVYLAGARFDRILKQLMR